VQRLFELWQISQRIVDGKQFDTAVSEVFHGGAGVVTVVSVASEDENQIVRRCELARAPGEFPADASDDLGPGLAGGPGGVFPFSHLGGADDWNWHGRSVAEFTMAQKEN
jgi:hypothetical protein